MMHNSQIYNVKPELKPNSELKVDGLPSAKLLPNPLLAAALVHFGSTSYDLSKVEPIKNDNRCKPKGGLWISPVNSNWGWKDWCESKNFRDCDLANSFQLKLKSTANVFVIDSYSDLKNAPLIDLKIGEHYHKQYLDFELLAKTYDAIWLTEKVQNETHLSRPLSLYGWDCESVLIMNPNCCCEVS